MGAACQCCAQSPAGFEEAVVVYEVGRDDPKDKPPCVSGNASSNGQIADGSCAKLDEEQPVHCARIEVDQQAQELAPFGTSLSMEKPSRLDLPKGRASTSEDIVLESTVLELRELRVKEAKEAFALCQFQRAVQILRAAGKLPLEIPELKNLPTHIERVKHVKETCTPQSGNGWKQFDCGFLSLCRRWDPETCALTLIMRWVARGSCQQHLASARDADAAESLWDGVWDMRSQHAGCVSLCRWLQNDPFTGRKTEVIMERSLCDCLDDDSPCWVMLERSPEIVNFEQFSGKWGSFDIPACPKGFIRAIAAESGRVIEPVTSDSCRISMSLTLQLPAVIRWVVTDILLCFAVNKIAQETSKSWDNIIDKWDSSSLNDRMSNNASFYAPVADRLAAFFEAKHASS